MTSIYYLSFHKQPPKNVQGVKDSFSISPTIHNDLREDVYSSKDGLSVPITIAWLIEAEEREGKEAQFELVKEECVVDWIDPTQAYRNVQINIPSNKVQKAKSNLRLALYVKQQQLDANCNGTIKPWRFNLSAINESIKKNEIIFIPIISSPIKIGSSKITSPVNLSPALGRQFSIGEDKYLFMEENAGFDLEGHLWDAALHLVRWLSSSSSGIRSNFSSDVRSLHILELGAGTGFVSIALRSLLDYHFIRATDLPSAMEVLQRNVDINHDQNQNGNLKVDILDWQEIPKAYENQSSYIFIADCTYNPSYFEPLCKAIKVCLKPPDGICYLAKKHRHIDEDSLWSFMEKAGLTYQLIHGHHSTLAEGSQYEYTGWGIYKVQHVL